MANDISGLYPAANAWFQNEGMGYFPGQTQAGFTDMQKQSWESGLGAANNIQGAGAGMIGGFNKGPQDVKIGGGMDMFNNPYLQESIQAGMQQNNQNFERNVMPGISQGATGSGMSGSSKQGIAQGLAASDLNQQNLNMASQMNQQAYDQGMQNHLAQRGQDIGVLQGNQQNAANWMGMTPDMLGAYSQSQMSPFLMQQGIGGQQQDFANRSLQGEMDRWNYTRDQPYNKLNQYAGLLGAGSGMPTQGDTSGGQMDWGAGLTGLGNAFMNMGGGDIDPFGGSTDTGWW